MKILKKLVFFFLVFFFLVVTFIPANTFPIRITDANLDHFEDLLANLYNNNILKLSFINSKITDEQLADILNQGGGNLRKLSLCNCHNLHNFEAIRNLALERNIKLYI